MRGLMRTVLLATAAGALACSGARTAAPGGTADRGLDAVTSVGSSSVATTPSGGFPPGECGYPPPEMNTPRDGDVVFGQVRLEPPVFEGPCYNGATTLVRIFDAAGRKVGERCAWPFDPIQPWNTWPLPDGAYSITTQRACSCTPCAETGTLHVTVRNAHGP